DERAAAVAAGVSGQILLEFNLIQHRRFARGTLHDCGLPPTNYLWLEGKREHRKVCEVIAGAVLARGAVVAIFDTDAQAEIRLLIQQHLPGRSPAGAVLSDVGE